MENSTGRMGIGIISAGRVGAALGSALRAAGHGIVGAHAPSPQSRERLEVMLPGVPALDVPAIVERSELVILALPDEELEGLVAGLAKLGAWQAGQIVVHTSARRGVEVLAPAQAAGALTLALHPVMEFSGTSVDVARLQGAHVVVSAANAIQPIGLALAAEMGAQGVVVNSADRAIYAAALAHARQGVELAASQAGRVLAQIGVAQPGDLLGEWAQAGLDRGLFAGNAAGAYVSSAGGASAGMGPAAGVAGALGGTGPDGVVGANRAGAGVPRPPAPPSAEEAAQRVEALGTLAVESPELADVAKADLDLLEHLVERALMAGVIGETEANELHTIVGAARCSHGGR